MTKNQVGAEPLLAPSELVNLTNCDREPVHIPGYIQPHGVLFVLSEPDFNIVQLSTNTLQWLGRAPEDFLNKHVSILLGAAEIQAIGQCLAGDFEYVNPLRVDLQTPNGTIAAHCITHRVGDAIVLEIELGYTEPVREEIAYFDFYRQVKAPIAALQSGGSFEELCDHLVKSVRHITGFDRVMLYRFEPSGDGNVIAEARHPDLVPYLGLRYPASDIPLSARLLYALNHLRLVPDITYKPIELLPQLNPLTQEPLDLSWSVLRSISPLHIEYLQNMGVRSSMSISLVREGKLWGLIACHHREPKLIPYFLRTVCEFIGQIAAFELTAKADLQDRDYQIEIDALKVSFFESISRQTDVLTALTQSPTDLLNLVGATGVAIAIQDEFTVFGNTPSVDRLRELLVSLAPRLQAEAVVQTVRLVQEYPESAVYSDIASGMLAMMVSRAQNFYILWFRPEVAQIVSWGGDPSKTASTDENGEIRLSPRKSFSAWQETVRQTALPWKTSESTAALELKSAIVNVALRHAAEVSQLNLELTRSNVDLDSFAYVASHDLKEPLRGIHNYSSFLLEDYGEILDSDGVSKINTLIRLTRRMENLIDSLLHYSRLGRSELATSQLDLNLLLQEVVELFKITTDALDVTVLTLPAIWGDRTQIGELFTNLVSNGIKYNTNTPVKIEIGVLDPAIAAHKYRDRLSSLPETAHIFYVRDNGIGIDPIHFEDVFRIFKRLHVRDEYGGGTGAGLTISQKIVDRHGGKIWVESVLGQGSTFYFALSHNSTQ
ncbi:ATP-binding protein [Chamaesiphon sp.]|uniref:ATP-binding protein n=1 Tax=Chamaesiphon sp. TaxID=2814140 RepID=UPI003593016A